MNLTQKVLYYQNGQWELENLLVDVNTICREWMTKRSGRLSDDEQSEFLEYLQPRLVKMINRFSFTGKSFTRYLRRMLHFQIRSYLARKAQEHISNRAIQDDIRNRYQTIITGGKAAVICKPDYWPESASPESLASDAKVGESADRKAGFYDLNELSPDRKRLLLLAMHRADSWDDEDIRKMSRKLGVPELRLLAIRGELMTDQMDRSEAQQKIRTQRNKAYMSLHSMSRGEDPQRQEMLRRRIAGSVTKLQKSISTPTHARMSEVTGIPKGTIDSGLYHLRRKGLNRLK